MKCSKRCIFSCAGVVIALALAISLFACTSIKAMKGPFTEQGVNPSFVAHVADKAQDTLKLTVVQRDELEGAITDVAKQAFERHQAMHGFHDVLAVEVEKDALDPAALDNIYQQKLAYVDEIYTQARDRLVAFHATLTPEQRAKLAEHLRETKDDKRCFGRHGW